MKNMYNDRLTILYWAYRRQDGRWDVRDAKGNYHIRSFNLNIIWMLRHPAAVIKLIREARWTTNFYWSWYIKEMKSRIPREIKTYNNKIEWLQAVHSRIYYPFMRREKDGGTEYVTDRDFMPWHGGWCEVSVRVLIDPEYGLLLYR